MTDHADPGPSPDQDGLVWMPAREAAHIYEVEARTIRKRIAANKIPGKMVNGMWFVGVTRKELNESGVDVDELEIQHGQIGDDLPRGTVVLRSHEPDPGPVDLAPMSDLIADLTHKSIEASAAAAMWQERANQLEHRLNSTTLALESGKEEAAATQQRLERDMQEAVRVARQEAADERDEAWRGKPWWKRMWGE